MSNFESFLCLVLLIIVLGWLAELLLIPYRITSISKSLEKIAKHLEEETKHENN